VRSGVPIVNSLEIVAKTSGNKVIEEAVIKAKKSIQEGVPISVPLEESKVFPPMVVKMIGVGETTGKLEAMLSKIAEFYEEQTEAVISSLTSLIEPLVIGFLGIVIGGIVVALFLPIISITTMLGH
jgi:type IV pilus assembly protein PilC